MPPARPSTAWPFAGTATLLVAGLCLAAWMLAALAIDPARAERDPAGSSRGWIAVVVPERDDWLEFVEAARWCDAQRRFSARLLQPDWLVITTPGGIGLDLVWIPAHGAVETRAKVRTLARKPTPPLAVIGSTDTRMTVALAETLAAVPWPRRQPPALLVPWATSMLMPSRTGDGAPAPLLRIYPGRTIRFCASNDRIAETLVHCVQHHAGQDDPAQVVIVEEPSDPYSVDLARSFRRMLEASPAERPGVTTIQVDAGPTLGPITDRAWFRELLAAITESAPAAAPRWLVLPLQGPLATEIIQALASEPRLALDADRRGLEILCGDGVGRDDLAQWAGRLPWRVWCFGTDLVLGPSMPGGLALENQIPAEILTALAWTLDRQPASAEGLLRGLAGLRLEGLEREALGRVIAIDATGERAGQDLGDVLVIQPGHPGVGVYHRAADGAWNPVVWIGPPRPREAPP